jgi:hypothetical protein
MLALADTPQAELLDTLFVGEEWVSYGYEVRRQFESWRAQRRGLNGSAKLNGHLNGNSSTSSDELLDEESLPI